MTHLKFPSGEEMHLDMAANQPRDKAGKFASTNAHAAAGALMQPGMALTSAKLYGVRQGYSTNLSPGAKASYILPGGELKNVEVTTRTVKNTVAGKVPTYTVKDSSGKLYKDLTPLDLHPPVDGF